MLASLAEAGPKSFLAASRGFGESWLPLVIGRAGYDSQSAAEDILLKGPPYPAT